LSFSLAVSSGIAGYRVKKYREETEETVVPEERV
jgi:hypothetical protein